MRIEQFVLPIPFTWKVARRGYRWIDWNEGRWLCAVDALERPDFPGVFDRYQTQQPLLERTGLFREFAELDSTETEVLNFANNFGLLRDGGNLAVDTEFGRTLLHAVEPSALASGGSCVQTRGLALGCDQCGRGPGMG
jgi:hypothetical protein